MSQLYDFFLCSREQIDRWTAAMAEMDEDRQAQIEESMPAQVTLQGLGNNEFEMLAACVTEEEPDLVAAAASSDMVHAVSEEEGPWILSLNAEQVAAVAKATLDDALLEKWIAATAEFQGGDVEWLRELLTLEAAQDYQQMCQAAVADDLKIYLCFYG
ncbi:hypothetical protein [Blastopirellula marina]|uniref:Uncharacterized protein n=1 Tax=Blastopirellula marina TaxID=124 RepID=A0A2S8GNE9_9BACT|nr:hypothetical protein [Blastopirellula marina]PQO45881.1 hypothetical protein C5Y93_11535 [Blastopirellula marina]